MCDQNVKNKCTALSNDDKIKRLDEETFFKLFQFLADWYVFPEDRAESLLARILKALANQQKSKTKEKGYGKM